MTIKIDRSHVCKLMIACSTIYNGLINEALDPDTSIERKERRILPLICGNASMMN